jgi:uncharacterized protein
VYFSEAAMAAAPLVYFEIAGPDISALRTFYRDVFEWSIGADGSVAAARSGAPRGGLRADPADKVFYFGVADIEATLRAITAGGGVVVVPRTVVPNVVTFALFRDPAGNLLGLAEAGSFTESTSAS